MNSFSEGLIFIPEQRVESRNALVDRVLAFIGGPEHILQQDVNVLDTNIRNLSLPDALERLYQSKHPVSFLIDLGGFTTEVWFEQPQQGYYFLLLDVDKYLFREIEGDPSRVEVFAAAWLRFSIAMQGSAAIFSNAFGDSKKLYIETHLTPLVEHDINRFANGVNWRTYLEPELAQLWHEQRQRGFYPMEELPSGALILHSGRGYNPEIGDHDIALQFDFLIAYLEKHQHLPDSKRLLARMQEQQNGPLQRYLELDEVIIRAHAPTELRNEYYALKESLRNLLDDVRATLAYARKQEDVVSLYQPVTLQENSDEAREIEVPVVRAQGHIWVMATLLYPFTLDAFFWRDKQQGLPTRVQAFLDAAHQHPVDGELPQVMVFFWHGVTQEVRDQLEAMRAQIEVSPDPIPLLEDALASQDSL